MIGVFVQVNGDSPQAEKFPVGYIICESGCWEWVGSKNRGGYGQYRRADGRSCSAHRYMYEKAVGPVPSGLQLDHLCRKRDCVNPAHLEPVTQRENILGGVGWTAQQARKTRCKRGHEFGPPTPDSWGRIRRFCATCDHAKSLARHAKPNLKDGER